MGIAGLDGYFKRLNPAFSETLGYTEEELLAQPFLELVHPDDQPATLAATAKLTEGNLVVGFENRYRSKDGSWRWLEWKSVAAVEEGVIYAAARDVTERKAAEAALLRMRDELEVRVQERTTELAQANAALQIQIAEREGAEAATRARARQQEAVAELGHRALTDIDMGTLLNGAAALVTATLNVELSAILELLPGGDTLRIRAGAGWATDVIGQVVPGGTDSQAGYAVLSNTPAIVLDWRTETRFKPSALLVRQGIISGIAVIVAGSGQPFGTLGAHTTQQRVFTQDDVHFLQSVSNILAAAFEQRRIETEIRQLNARLKDTNEQLHKENIERRLALNALHEVTADIKKAKEEAEAARKNAEVANHAKSEFLSRMSHELRTPLNAILGFGQMLDMRSQHADAQQQDNIQQILKAGRHLLALINEVLDIARIEAGHLSLSPEPVEVGRLVRETLDLVRPLAAARHITLVNELNEEYAAQHVLADQQRLKQVLLNFLSNAVKYNRAAGHVTVACEVVDKDMAATYEGIACVGRLRLMVRDTGPGLTPQDLDRLFMPFERLGAANSTIEGTGIGLAICKPLLAAMHGRIGAASEDGQGSTFWLELPLTPRLPQLNGGVEMGLATPAEAPVFDSPRTILYIEDNLSNIRLIERLLSDLSGQIRLLTAMQGSLGVELATQHQPDLILLDVNLPDIMGDEVLRRLKANAVTQAIPVVALSADATSRQIERILAAGAIQYLTKPLDVEQFLSVLEEVLKATTAAKE